MALVDRVLGHAVHAALDSLRAAVGQALTVEDLLADGVEILERADHAIEHAQSRLAAADASLVPVAVLNNMNAAATNASAALAQYLQDRGPAHLSTVDSQMESIIHHATQLPPPIAPADPKKATAAANAFHKALAERLATTVASAQSAQQSFEGLRAKAEEVQRTVEEQRTRVDAFVAELQRQHTTNESDRATRFDAAEQQRAETSRQALQRTEERATTAHDERAQRFAELVSEAAKSRESGEKNWEILQADLVGKADAQRTRLEEEAGALIARLTELKAKAESLVGVVATTGMAGGYQIVANEEQQAARKWRLATAASITLLVGFAFKSYLDVAGTTSPAGFSVSLFLARALVTGALAAFAAYAARQAHKHHVAERHNRHMQLQLNSIDLYLAPMSEEVQNEVKKERVPKLFPGGVLDADLERNKSRNEVTGPVEVADAIKTVAVEAIKTISKK